MSMSGLKSAVLEAGGNIESRAAYPDYHKSVEKYVFDAEALKRFIELVKNEPTTLSKSGG
jgi:hypothetical protein